MTISSNVGSRQVACRVCPSPRVEKKFKVVVERLCNSAPQWTSKQIPGSRQRIPTTPPTSLVRLHAPLPVCDKRVGNSRCMAAAQQSDKYIWSSNPTAIVVSIHSSRLPPSWANATSSSPSSGSTTATALWLLYTTNGSTDTVLCDNVYRPCVS